MRYFPAQITRLNTEKLRGRAFQEKAQNLKFVEARYDKNTGLITEVKNPYKKLDDGSITFVIDKSKGSAPTIEGKCFGEDYVDDNVRHIIEDTIDIYNKEKEAY